MGGHPLGQPAAQEGGEQLGRSGDDAASQEEHVTGNSAPYDGPEEPREGPDDEGPDYRGRIGPNPYHERPIVSGTRFSYTISV
jgi:hypothetical protein